MVGRDLLHLLQQLAEGLAVVPQVALPGLDVDVVQVDLDLLAERQRLDVGVVLVIDVEVQVGEVDVQLGDRACVSLEAAERLVDGALDLRRAVSRNASTELSSRLSRLTVMSFFRPCSRPSWPRLDRAVPPLTL